uniref:Protein phosphatase 1 regulatory subunit 14A n=1 Tax=Lepisosteus oculatus TaxID=7918 RepID=W5NBX3_LEPOC
MAANRVGRRYNHKVHSPNRGPREPGLHLQKRQARVTVKYNRKELQKRLDVEKWIDDRLAELYLGRERAVTRHSSNGIILRRIPSDSSSQSLFGRAVRSLTSRRGAQIDIRETEVAHGTVRHRETQ